MPAGHEFSTTISKTFICQPLAAKNHCREYRTRRYPIQYPSAILNAAAAANEAAVRTWFQAVQLAR